MNFTQILVVVSAFISVAGSAAYIRDTLKGQTKPNRVSWGMWALAPLIGTAAAISASADIWATVRTFLAGFLPLIVFLVSFTNRQSYWKTSIFDYACGVCAAIALVIWLKADMPTYAILFAALGDGFASLPTIFKAWKYPETETGVTYMASLVSVLLVLPSIPVWNIENSAFQVYLLFCNIILLFAVYRKSFRFSKNNAPTD